MLLESALRRYSGLEQRGCAILAQSDVQSSSQGNSMKRTFTGVGIVFAATTLCSPGFALSDVKGRIALQARGNVKAVVRNVQ